MPGPESGYVFDTLDSSDYPIDEAEDISIDKTLEDVPIQRQDIYYGSFLSISGGLFAGSLEFQTK